ncbi:MAG: subunit of succinyl-CoA:benzylsuccinate CoA-transferase [Acidimicrobiia bacterium]|nr:subunit of succinyl-CoA:benzylsuccinate CoA-transferase [Acidimicrobiia bacterium]
MGSRVRAGELMDEGFLAGYRVLDLCDERGLLAGRLFADLGADVVLVEAPAGNTARRVAPRSSETSSFVFDVYGANRRGVVADIETEEGRSRVFELARHADFLVESLDPEVRNRCGLDWAALHRHNPALIHASVSAFGSTGPKANYAHSDLIAWAAGGPLQPHRDEGRPPVRISIPQAFLQASADAVAGCLIAHFARLQTGRGQHVDVAAQTSVGVATLGQILAHAVGDANPSWERRVIGGDQSGSGAGTATDQKKWRCRDGMVEFHLGMGPAAGRFTNGFFRWVADDGGLDDVIAAVDWRTVPALIKEGSFSAADLERARTAAGEFLASKSQREVLRAATDRKLTCVPIYDTGSVAASEQLAARDFWIDVGGGDRQRRMPGRFARVTSTNEAFAFRRPAPLIGEHTDEVEADWNAQRQSPSTRLLNESVVPSASGSAPLDGLMVLDLSWVVAGPLIGRAFADFGATVVRVESSTRPETARLMPPFYGGQRGPESSALYGTCNAGKLGLTVDLADPKGREVVRALARRADVVIEAFSPGTMARWGLDYHSLSAEHPDLIMLSTSIMGQTGPYRALAGFGNVGAALSGFQDIVGWPDRAAIGPFGPYTDFLGPRLSLVVLLAALERRRVSGAGCHIDVAQTEAGVYFQGPELAQFFANGTVTTRIGNRDRDFAPHGVYRCLDEGDEERFVAIAVCSDGQWTALADVLQLSAAERAMYASVTQRHEHHDELDTIIERFTCGRQALEVEHALQQRAVPCHLVASSRDISSDPQVRHRGYLVSLPHERFGTVTVEGPRFLLSETPGKVERAAPTFHHDNHVVVVDMLGYSEARYDELTEEGVLR